MKRNQNMFRNKEVKQTKTSRQQSLRNSSKKPERNKKNDIDSLTELRSSVYDDIDDRIKFFKSELSLMLGETSKSVDALADSSCNSDILILEKSNPGDDLDEPKMTDIFQKPLKNESSSTKDIQPTKFTTWMHKAIEKNEKNLIVPDIAQLHLQESNKKTLHDKKLNYEQCIPSSNDTHFKSRYPDMSLLPQHKIERLLYRAFEMQHFGRYSDSSDETESDIIKAPNKRKKQRHKKPRKKTPRLSIPKNNKPRCRKRKRVISLSSTNTEIIDIEKENITLDSSEITIENSDVECDLRNYDWSEPFELDDRTETHLSYIEIIENATIDIESDTNEQPIIQNSKNTPLSKKTPISKNTPLSKKIPISKKTPVSKRTPVSKSTPVSKRTPISKKTPVSKRTPISKMTHSTAEKGKESDMKKKVWECPICFEPSTGQEIVATVCGHIFCKICLDIHQKIRKNCPSCRTDLSGQPLITLYNI